MKKLLLTSLGIFLGFFLFAQNLPEVFSSMSVKIKEGHSPPEVTNYVKAGNQALQKFGRGLACGLVMETEENRLKNLPGALPLILRK